MRSTNTSEATFRIVTPLFLGGAKPDDSAELRVPPIKAVLRFWWRARKWTQIKSSQPQNNIAIAELRKQEAALFGATDGGQSQVMLAIRRAKNIQVVEKGSVLEEVTARPGARYLGYGVMQAGQLTRSCIRRNAEFTMELRARSSLAKRKLKK